MTGYLFSVTSILMIMSIGPLVLAVITALLAEAKDQTRFKDEASLIASKPKAAIRYFFGCFWGSLTAAVTIVAATITSQWWDCAKAGLNCYDGQGGIQLILTVPVAWLFGALVGVVWTRFTLRADTHSLHASISRYAGPQRLWNRFVAYSVPPSFWIVVGFCLFRLMITR